MSSAAERFVETSPWMVQPEERQRALQTSTTADFVVVGGGITGLSAALALRDSGADVVVLEQDFAGFGASGRNAGHLTPTIGKDLPTLLRLFGRERASALVRFADAAVDYAIETMRKYEIDCDYHAGGNLLGGLLPRHEASLARVAEAARELGAEVRYLKSDELRERGVPPAFRCAVLEEKGGTLDPGRYVAGLRERAIGAGVRLFESTRVEALRDGPKVEARTRAGSVRAPAAILATNAYTAALGRRRRHVVPARVSLFETEPIDDKTLAELDWRGREGVYSAHEILESYRLSARRTVVGGSRFIRYAYGSGLSSGFDPKAFGVIERAFRERFPVLEGTSVAHFWGGWIGMTLDFLPQFGREGQHENVHYGIGFNGHGVAQATLLGDMLAQRCLGQKHEHEKALRRRLWAWPPEPLRWIGAELIIGGLRALDARTDRRIRSLPN